MASRTIRFECEIETPDEGYDDVCLDLIIVDFMESPKHFGFRALEPRTETTRNAEKPLKRLPCERHEWVVLPDDANEDKHEFCEECRHWVVKATQQEVSKDD